MTQTIKLLSQGSQRSCLPEQTIAKYKPLSKSMGITRIADITGLDIIGIPVVTVCRPNSKAISVAQGKGPTLAAAQASGLMEAIETFHGEFIDLPLRLASYHHLSEQTQVVDIYQLPKLNINRFDQHRECLWILADDISHTGQKQATTTAPSIYVPYEIVHCNYTLPFATGSGMFMMTTNGLASGNTLSEAIFHGLCEVIERDAVTLWQLSPKQDEYPLVNLSTINDTQINQLLEQFQQANMQVNVWDITSDIGAATFYCTIMNKAADERLPMTPASGQGTHPDKNIALIRALTEAAQSRLTLISGSRDDANENNYQHNNNLKAHHAKLKQLQSYKHFIDFKTIKSTQYQTVEQDIAHLINQLQLQNLNQVLVVDLTKPQYNIPVVRVIVPGLEGINSLQGYVKGNRAKATGS